jgi:hypothetical protein
MVCVIVFSKHLSLFTLRRGVTPSPREPLGGQIGITISEGKIRQPGNPHHKDTYKNRSHLMDDQALRDYFEFDELDLATNRNGKLSKKQQEKLVELDKGSNPILIGLALFSFAIASIFPLVFR